MSWYSFNPGNISAWEDVVSRTTPKKAAIISDIVPFYHPQSVGLGVISVKCKGTLYKTRILRMRGAET